MGGCHVDESSTTRMRRTSTARLAQIHLEIAEIDIGVALVIVARLVIDLGPAIVLGRATERLAVTLVLALAVDAAIGVGEGVQPRLGDLAATVFATTVGTFD